MPHSLVPKYFRLDTLPNHLLHFSYPRFLALVERPGFDLLGPHESGSQTMRIVGKCGSGLTRQKPLKISNDLVEDVSKFSQLLLLFLG
jgi:hypothetical protein